MGAWPAAGIACVTMEALLGVLNLVLRFQLFQLFFVIAELSTQLTTGWMVYLLDSGQSLVSRLDCLLLLLLNLILVVLLKVDGLRLLMYLIILLILIFVFDLDGWHVDTFILMRRIEREQPVMRLTGATLVQPTVIYFTIFNLIWFGFVTELIPYVTLEFFLGLLIALHQVRVRLLRLLFVLAANVHALRESLLALDQAAHNLALKLLLAVDLAAR